MYFIYLSHRFKTTLSKNTEYYVKNGKVRIEQFKKGGVTYDL